jgi:hypothetical protein
MSRPFRISREKARAAHILYRNGMDLPEIAELLWEKLGFPNANACRCSLRLQWKSMGLWMRSREEAWNLRRTKLGITAPRLKDYRPPRRQNCPTCNGQMSWGRKQCFACYHERRRQALAEEKRLRQNVSATMS